MRKKVSSTLVITGCVTFVFLLLFSFRDKPSKRKIIYAQKAPKPIGPYSQAVMVGKTVYVSGQIAMDTAGVMDTADIRTETKRVLSNVSEILRAAGLSASHVVKATVYMKDLKKFSVMNEVYADFFEKDSPARETIEVKSLPKGANLEISVIAEAD